MVVEWWSSCGVQCMTPLSHASIVRVIIIHPPTHPVANLFYYCNNSMPSSLSSNIHPPAHPPQPLRHHTFQRLANVRTSRYPILPHSTPPNSSHDHHPFLINVLYSSFSPDILHLPNSKRSFYYTPAAPCPDRRRPPIRYLSPFRQRPCLRTPPGILSPPWLLPFTNFLTCASSETCLHTPSCYLTMSSATTAAETAADANAKPARRFPPPCWTQEETLALIDAYRERWYALRRGYLRTADWDAVAAAVAQRCPDASPAKTSAQCRHKMEKLRQRYRAEKQRSLAFPTGRFFSSWFFFENMDSMENGNGLSAAGSNLEHVNRQNPDSEYPLKTLSDQNFLKLKLNQKNNAKLGGDHGPRAKTGGKIEESSRILNGYTSHVGMSSDVKNEEEDEEEDEEDQEEGNVDFRSRFCAKTSFNGVLVPPGFKSKKPGKFYGNLKSALDFSDRFDYLRPSTDQDCLPSAFRGKKHVKNGRTPNSINDCDQDGENDGSNANNGIWSRMQSGRNLGAQEHRSLGNNTESRVLNGVISSWSTSGSEKKSGNAGGGGKRGRDVVEEMVLSIKMLGEGFVKMEKMKMEMAREMEKMRMEMEIKRNELILESQQQIVDAFLKVLSEKNKSKNAKLTLPSEP